MLFNYIACNSLNYQHAQMSILKMHAGIFSIISLFIFPVCNLHTQNTLSMHLGHSKGDHF